MAAPHPALVELAAGRVPSPVDDPDTLLASAWDHRMQGLLWDAVRREELRVGHQHRIRLAGAFLQTKARHRRLWESLDAVTTALDAIGVEVAVAKGVAAEARWYPGMGTRPSADLDLLVPPWAVERSRDIVVTIEPGHVLADSIVPLVRSGDLQSVDLVDEAGTSIDLHFDILKVEVATRRPEVIWERTVGLDTPGGTQVRTLDAEMSLVHFLLHINKDRFAHLLAFADIVRIVQTETLDWDFIDSFVRHEGLDTHVYQTLETVMTTIGLPAPHHPRSGPWRSRLWRVLWPERIRLRGGIGRVRRHRRQYWIGATARGRLGEAAIRWGRRMFPAKTLLPYYFPRDRGPYLVHLVSGRLRSLFERRSLIRSLENWPPPVMSTGEPADSR